MDSLITWLSNNCERKEDIEKWKELKDVFTFEINKETEVRRLIVIANLHKDTKLVIPPNCILTHTKVLEHFKNIESVKTLDKYTQFAVFLHSVVDDSNSFWKAYIGVLPAKAVMRKTHPIFYYLDKENSNLEFSHFEKQALKVQNQKMKEEFKLVTVLFRELHFEDFLYFVSLVISRAFEISSSREMVMIPFADSLNHAENLLDCTVVWRPSLPKGNFVLRISRNLLPGEELTASYFNSHHATNVKIPEKSHRLLMYGF